MFRKNCYKERAHQNFNLDSSSWPTWWNTLYPLSPWGKPGDWWGLVDSQDWNLLSPAGFSLLPCVARTLLFNSKAWLRRCWGDLPVNDFPCSGHVGISPVLYNCSSLIASLTHRCFQLSICVSLLCCLICHFSSCSSTTGMKAVYLQTWLAANQNVVLNRGCLWGLPVSLSVKHITDWGVLLPLPAMLLMLL